MRNINERYITEAYDENLSYLPYLLKLLSRH